MLLDLAEQTYDAYFTDREKKSLEIGRCIIINDKIKFLLCIGWEGRLISNQHYENISTKVHEVGKIFGGWRRSLENPEKKNQSFKGPKEQSSKANSGLNI